MTRMHRWLFSLSTSLYVLGVAVAVPAAVRYLLEPAEWWPVTVCVIALLYLIPMTFWFASIKPATKMSASERARRMVIAGTLVFAFAFVALALPCAFVILTGDAMSPFRSLVYAGIWFVVMLTSQLRRKKRPNQIEAYGRAREAS